MPRPRAPDVFGSIFGPTWAARWAPLFAGIFRRGWRPPRGGALAPPPPEFPEFDPTGASPIPPGFPDYFPVVVFGDEAPPSTADVIRESIRRAPSRVLGPRWLPGTGAWFDWLIDQILRPSGYEVVHDLPQPLAPRPREFVAPAAPTLLEILTQVLARVWPVIFLPGDQPEPEPEPIPKGPPRRPRIRPRPPAELPDLIDICAEYPQLCTVTVPVRPILLPDIRPRTRPRAPPRPAPVEIELPRVLPDPTLVPLPSGWPTPAPTPRPTPTPRAPTLPRGLPLPTGVPWPFALPLAIPRLFPTRGPSPSTRPPPFRPPEPFVPGPGLTPFQALPLQSPQSPDDYCRERDRSERERRRRRRKRNCYKRVPRPCR